MTRTRAILRRLRTVLGVLAASAVLAGLTGLVTGGAANAASCKTTHTYTHRTTSTGTQSWTWTTRTACGKAYQRWTHENEVSSTGSRFTENVYRDERAYPHYRQVTDKYSWSKKNVETHTYVIKTG